MVGGKFWMAGGAGPKMSRPTHGKIKDYPLKRIKYLEIFEFNQLIMLVIITFNDVYK